MSYCTKCGAEVPEESLFCGSCGNRIKADVAVPAEEVQTENLRQRKKMHCPVCKGRNFSPTTEATSHQGASYRLTKRVSVGGGTTTNRTYWLCADCGKKFRNIQELEEDVNKYKKLISISGGMTVLVLFMILIAPEIWVIMFLPLLCCVGLTLGFWICLHQLKKELEYLKTNCFD